LYPNIERAIDIKIEFFSVTNGISFDRVVNKKNLHHHKHSMTDATPESIELRDKMEENLQHILYHGAKQRREY
jgi:hypothetical protein